jgi:hypothetical protein
MSCVNGRTIQGRANTFREKLKKNILRAADVSNLEIFEVINLQFFTMFSELPPLFKTVFKIVNRNVC